MVAEKHESMQVRQDNETQTKTEAPVWCNRVGIAHRYAVSLRTVDSLRKRRILPHVKLGRVIRFNTAACDKALQAFEVKAV